tara:strand:+ start:1082 stop:1318 length:237 start_codon:yes stop_codon:yes gene_type:complete
MTSVKPKVNMLTSDLEATYERLNAEKKLSRKKKKPLKKKKSLKKVSKPSRRYYSTAHGGRTKSAPGGESGSTGGPGGQ